MKLQGVGVVVIGRNEGQRLAACITSLAEHSATIVYVDSGSNDGSLDVAAHLGAIPHALTPDRPFNAARARNAGAQRLTELFSQVQLIQFIDGDCVLAPDWIEKAHNFLCTNPRAAVVCGRRRERFPHHSVYNRLMDLEWDAPVGKVESCGGDAMFRRVAFEEVGGFDDRIVAGEEPELCFRLRRNNWTVWRIASEMTLHDAGLRSFSQWWRRSTRSGYGCAQLWSLHKAGVNTGLSRQLFRSLFWSAVGLLSLLSGAFVSKWFLALLIAYPAQIIRMAVRPGAPTSDRWAYATITTVSQFAGFQGICMFAWQAITGQVPRSAAYK